jgi:iron complex transport system substrate-binding protein
MRIVSLLPSATEIVCALGLEDELVGISHDCDWPPGLRDRKVVLSEAAVHSDMSSVEIDQTVKQLLHNGLSVYHLDAEKLQELRPDLILTQELCEVCAPSFAEVQNAATILDTAPKIVSLEPTSLDEILESILLVGALTDREERARELVAKLRARIERVRSRTESLERIPRVLALEWLAPLYVGGHWVPEMIELAGGESLGPPGEPSYEIVWIDVKNFDPQVIVLMPCGFSPERTLKEIDLLTSYEDWEELRAVKNGDVYLVHGPYYFNRPGPRIVVGLEILAKILHPELFKDVEIPKGSMYPLHEGSYDEDLHTNGRRG